MRTPRTKWLDFNFSATIVVLLICGVCLSSCGRIYFPIELKTLSRDERYKGQEDNDIRLVSMTKEVIESANKSGYKRRIIDAGDLNKPARIIPAEQALEEKLPKNNDPGPYKIGVGDQLSFVQSIRDVRIGNDLTAPVVTRNVSVSDDGFVNFFEIGRVKAEGLSQSQLEDEIYKRLIANGKNGNFELSISGFFSKRIYVSGDDIIPRTIPFSNIPIFLEDVLIATGLRKTPGADAKISIIRDGREYVVSLTKLSKTTNFQLRLFPDDKIYVTSLNYRAESVLVVGETGAQRAFEINSYQRPTLAETIFSGSVLNSVTSDFSQIYVLREKKDEYLAYHLDITDPSRINLAKKFEMRPDDIVFVATQPLSLYSRTLSQILGSTGLTLQARDTIRTEIGN